MRINSIGATSYGVQKNNNVQRSNVPSFGMAVDLTAQTLGTEYDYFDGKIEAAAVKANKKGKDGSLIIGWHKFLSHLNAETISKEAHARLHSTNSIKTDFRIITGALDSQGDVLLPILNRAGLPSRDKEKGRVMLVRLDNPIMHTAGNPYVDEAGNPLVDKYLAGPIFDSNGNLMYNKHGKAASDYDSQQEGFGRGPVLIAQAYGQSNPSGPYTEPVVWDDDGSPVIFTEPLERGQNPKAKFKDLFKQIDNHVTAQQEIASDEANTKRKAVLGRVAKERKRVSTEFARQRAKEEAAAVADGLSNEYPHRSSQSGKATKPWYL